MEQLGALWAIITAVQPALPLPLVLLCVAAAGAAVVLSPVWRIARHVVTTVHEAGHGLAATLSGRRLAGIRLHSDTSGVTVSVGRPRGPGMVLTLISGYPAPALLGLGAALLVGLGHGVGFLWALLGILALVLLQIRNWFGLVVVVVSVAAVLGVTLLLPPLGQTAVATTVAGFLCLGALRASVELQGARRREGAGRGRGTSDADQLARLTRVPAPFWVAVFVGCSLASAVVGGILLLRIDPQQASADLAWLWR
ncbi:MAG: M50 family metallopeptidase [Naasia sp.]